MGGSALDGSKHEITCPAPYDFALSGAERCYDCYSMAAVMLRMLVATDVSLCPLHHHPRGTYYSIVNHCPSSHIDLDLRLPDL